MSSGIYTAGPYQKPLTIVSSVALFASLSTIVFFAVLALKTRRVNLPLVKITMVIQSINVIALINATVLNQVHLTAPLLCTVLRYTLYVCYLTTIFMTCAITIHLWLVITRRKLTQANRIERWYYIAPIALAVLLSATLATIPSSVYHMESRCTKMGVPPREYYGLRWGFYYSWFVVASAISFYCMARVLYSTHQLAHSTHLRRSHQPSSTEAYRNQVNARANSERLRSLAFYTVAYPAISFVSHFPTLLQELMSFVLKRELQWLVFVSRSILACEGILLSLAFFLYPAVHQSIRDLVNSAVQYWVVDQEEFWQLRREREKHRRGRRNYVGIEDIQLEEKIVHDFTSRRGRFYHFIFSKTPEGRLATHM
ncbi:hypothetical protein LPJ61_001438 [Coemansia biformis]|uniref:Uncharacterized protein n=1 Tax=Coemansia biformis TaxID=1286918 RepID=A0A9W8D0M2_9FUNG|nr:hypothetical protein LPJ61_001438 [Coemansia biformis]